ncbi:lipoyl synthase [Clostridium kluyveri]|uniref:lipoyl synthase n=1 Tax=Clostridium kluyveri TaxID=1534 RepID=UPI00224802D5|nr:lipoyl synthase [Clostridium kluyveri]UZQ51204.1 lipoyl synthase [Clostridium kluyveri]
MYKRKPKWLKIKIRAGQVSRDVKEILKNDSLNTVCSEANCPNRMECFNKSRATFMILGKNCTRNCTFCNVTKGRPEKVDKKEPFNVAQAVDKLNLKHAVITSVTRDDLEDGGASHFASVVEEIRKLNKNITVEVLIPDFKGSETALKKVVDSKPNVINHNVETTPALYEEVRPMAVYKRSLELLKRVKIMGNSILTKSGFMLGLGEKEEDIIKVLKDLRKVDCDIVTIGQYLSPSSKHHAVVEYVHPDVFKKYKEIALDLGFKFVSSAPLVRSSYHADEMIKN